MGHNMQLATVKNSKGEDKSVYRCESCGFTVDYGQLPFLGCGAIDKIETKRPSPIFDCVEADHEDMNILEKGLGIILGHKEKMMGKEYNFFYRKHSFVVILKDSRRIS